VIGGYSLHGHAIVSADDRIANCDGVTPSALRFEADWTRFQAAIDRACLTVLGRRGHQINPNVKGRNRLVLSSNARGVERRDDAWWWNPEEAPLGDALARAAPDGGIVVVPGGRRVFDFFLSAGFDEFHLARAPLVKIPGGIPIFSQVNADISAEQILAANGLVPGLPEVINPTASVDVTIWRRV